MTLYSINSAYNSKDTDDIEQPAMFHIQES